MIGWLIEREAHDGFVAGLQSGFALTDPEFQGFERIARLPDARVDVRLNDAKATADGRIYAGSMELDGKGALGGLYRLDPDRRVTALDSGYGVANGPALSLDERTLYHTDSALGRIYAFRRETDGSLHDKRLFRQFETSVGSPDGMTIDAEDCLWVAHWDGGRLSRFSPDGRLVSTHPLPTSRITSCAFAGERLDRLFVTSASEGREAEPLAGALFELDVGVKGAPPRRFAG